MDKSRDIILGIETSCDETAAALVTSTGDVLAHALLSQVEDHAAYGGVVPEIAARAHVEHLDSLVKQALDEAGLEFADLSAVAATTGPGLVGGLMVGSVTGKAIALGCGLDFTAVNHLEAHALSPRLVADIPFPYLVLLISGGHCQSLLVEGVGTYRRIGTTIDDAAGEAFDKTAKLLGLAQPGGPAIEEWAKKGNPAAYDLPRPLMGTDGADFSFSGLKTAVARLAAKESDETGAIPDAKIHDMAAVFQEAVTDCLADRLEAALKTQAVRRANPRHLVVAGGVAANAHIRTRLEKLAEERGMAFVAPPGWLCTDNAVMVAWAAHEKRAAGQTGDDIEAGVRSRWPLDERAPPRVGYGKKGAKA